MSNKGLFRDFLSMNGFNTPSYSVVKNTSELEGLDIVFPVIVKPVDSSGSKGITKVSQRDLLYKAFHTALKFSRNKSVIIEEFIETKYNQLHGDAFVNNGKVINLF